MSGIIAQNSGRHTGLVKAGGAGGTWTLIKTLTSDGSDADLSFVNGASDVVLDNTYKEYCFKFINIHPETNAQKFGFNLSIDTGSNYNVAKTTPSFDAFNAEAGNDQGLRYDGDNVDLAQGTGVQNLNYNLGNGADSNLNGWMHIYGLGDTTFAKQFMAAVSWQYANTYSIQAYTAGYGNTTSAVDAVQFKLTSGEIQGGSISLYGIT